ncbi:MAG: hypothetical protein IJ518_08355 [Clostridia bacterium]|nr:hypothetical protein [Clostridia bacterium]
MTRRILSILFAVLVLVGCMAACGNGNTEESSSPVSNEASDTTTTADATTATTAGADATTGIATETTTGSRHTTGKDKVTTTQKATTTAKNEKQYNLKAADFIRNQAVFATRYRDSKVGFEAYNDFGRQEEFIIRGVYTTRGFDIDLWKKSMTDLGLGVNYMEPVDGLPQMVGEWGMNFFLHDAWKTYKPTTKKDALAYVRKHVFSHYVDYPYGIKPGMKGMAAINGHTFWEHYGAEFGFDYVGAEVGESVASHQTHMAFTRGAARQYNKVAVMYFSNWFNSFIGTYQDDKSIWGQYGGKDYGHSMNLIERTYLMSYMGGAGFFTFEAGNVLAFKDASEKDQNGYYALTPYGEMMQKMVAFSDKHRDIGYNYTPIGVVLDYYHGLMNVAPTRAAGAVDGSYGVFSMDEGTRMNIDVIQEFFPDGFFSRGHTNAYGSPEIESYYQQNNAYGDTCDFLLQNASQEVLNSYPVLLLSGDVRLSTEEVGRYVAYVKQGGTLLCNTAYLKYFDAYKSAYKGGTRQEIKDGKGTVIVYGPDYSVANLGSILQKLVAKYIPFTFSKEVQYLVNVKDGSLIVTVINNDGVEKKWNEQPTFDQSKAMNLDITYTGKLKIKQVKELFYGEKVTQSGNKVSTCLWPGDYRVFEFVFD